MIILNSHSYETLMSLYNLVNQILISQCCFLWTIFLWKICTYFPLWLFHPYSH